MSEMENKIRMYKAVEEICTSNHTAWNTIQGFPGAFSKFAVKVAKLDLTSAQDMPARASLIDEIDRLLSGVIDLLVEKLCMPGEAFCLAYRNARRA
jgi:hypothetical protein